MREGRQMFIAAKNSRHRVAALSLYRALIRTAQKITIPQDLTKNGRTHPVAHLVKKRFANHVDYTSFRLVYSAMATGYKFLTVLTKAQTTGSPEHSQVLNLLAERSSTANQSRRVNSSRTKPQSKTTKPKVPVLRNIAGPGESPIYVPNPRPEGERKPGRPPLLATDAYDIPFLRFTKPQPHVLGQMISRRRFLWIKRIDGVKESEKRLADARLEDEWDSLVEDQIASEKNTRAPAPKRRQTHQWSVLVSKLWYELALERLWDDWVARGDAFHKIVESEQAKLSGDDKGSLESVTNSMETVPDHLVSKKPDSERYLGMPALASWHQARRKLGANAEPSEADGNDTFISPIWAATIDLQAYRLIRWMDEGK